MDRKGPTFIHGEVSETPEEDAADADGHVNRLLAAYALGALDPAEMEQVARHIQRCPECRQDLAEFETVASLLPYAAEPLTVPVRARARLLSRLDEIGTPNAERIVVLRRPARPRGFAFSTEHLRRYAAFAVIPLVMVLAVVIVMGEIISEQQQELRATQEERAEAHRVLTSAEAGDPRFMTDLVTSPDAGGAALGRLFLDREANTAMIVARDLPEVADGQQYIVWLRFYDPQEFARAGELEVDEQGRGQLTLSPADPITVFDSLLITIESDPDASVPTGPQVMFTGLLPENLRVVP